MLLVVYVVMVGMNVGMCVAHVFCQDTHATDWTPLGYSCPINCAAVVAAVKRLKEKDYEELITAQQSPFSPHTLNMTYDFEDNSAEKKREIEHVDTDEENFIESPMMRNGNGIEPRELAPAHYVGLYRSLLDKRSGRELQTAFKYAARHGTNDSCGLLLKRRDKKSLLNKRCGRRSAIQEDLLTEFTDILNKQPATTDLFTNRMTAMLLEKLLGDSADIRLGILDVEKIVKRLSHLISVHKQHARAATHTITLKSKYCLNVYVPGCFCIPGYVEHEGQCVRPPDCFPDYSKVREYIARIRVQ